MGTHLVFAIACLVPLVALATAADDEKAVAALDTQYQMAVSKNDAATMDRILADDFVLVTGRGVVYTKADLLKDARAKTEVYERQEDTHQKVRVWGDTAVVTALLWGEGHLRRQADRVPALVQRHVRADAEGLALRLRSSVLAAAQGTLMHARPPTWGAQARGKAGDSLGMQIYELGTAGELHYERAGAFLVIKWKKLFQKNRENIALVEQLLVEVASRRVSKVIIDMTESSGTFPDEFMSWAQGPGMVRSAQAGVKYYVTVDPGSAVSKLSVTRWQNVASQNVQGIELTSVPSRKIAEDWLHAR